MGNVRGAIEVARTARTILGAQRHHARVPGDPAHEQPRVGAHLRGHARGAHARRRQRADRRERLPLGRQHLDQLRDDAHLVRIRRRELDRLEARRRRCRVRAAPPRARRVRTPSPCSCRPSRDRRCPALDQHDAVPSASLRPAHARRSTRRSGSGGSSTRRRPAPRTAPLPAACARAARTHASGSETCASPKPPAATASEYSGIAFTYGTTSSSTTEKGSATASIPLDPLEPEQLGLLEHRDASPAPACRAGSRACGGCASPSAAAARGRSPSRSSRSSRCAGRSRRARGRSSRSVSSPSTATALSFVVERVVEGELVVGRGRAPRRARSASRISLASSISSSMTWAVSIARFWYSPQRPLRASRRTLATGRRFAASAS